MTDERPFICVRCRRRDVYAATATPVCHGQPMFIGVDIFHGRDPEKLSFVWIDVNPAEAVFAVRDPMAGPFRAPPSWLCCWDIWYRVRGSRKHGERLGWIGETLCGFAYQAVPGIAAFMAEGIAPTKMGAFAKLYNAIQAG